MTYTNWDGGMPDDDQQFENCMHMWYDKGFWNDFSCNNTNPPQSTMCEVIFSCV